jgi:hypothetical protein
MLAGGYPVMRQLLGRQPGIVPGGPMPICKIPPPWEFLLSASRNSQQSYGLPRLSHASNLRKEISALIDQWMEENNSAMLARWLMEHREWETTLVEPAAADASGPLIFWRLCRWKNYGRLTDSATENGSLDYC